MDCGKSLIVADGVWFGVGGRDVLCGEVLHIRTGEVLAVCGGNGAGKTTLLKILAGLLSPDDGKVHYHFNNTVNDDNGGGDLINQNKADNHGGDIDDWREEVIYIGHKTGLCAQLTPLENMRVLASMRDRPPMCDMTEALAAWNADMDIPCARLSAGQLRRAALARLSVLAARVWLLDEPLVSLDSAGRERFFDSLRRHLTSGGGAAISCHHHNELPDDISRAACVIKLFNASSDSQTGAVSNTGTIQTQQ